MKTGVFRLLILFALGGGVFLAPPGPSAGDARAQEQGQKQEQAKAQPPAGIAAFVSEEEPPTFASSEEAVQAFKDRLAAGDLAATVELLGLDPDAVKGSEATLETFAAIREGAARRVSVSDLGDRVLIRIGRILWPLPFPVVKGEDGRWSFDTYAGLQEIVNRRIGENELEAIATARAYVEAQESYAAGDWDDDGVLEFAQKLVSSDGAQDGLYWPETDGAEPSPAGAFTDQAALDRAVEGEGYFGYRFRVLTGQGENIAGGHYDYIINGNMIAGFALVAWPVRYGETGVYTFAISHHGTLYQADLGPETDKIARAMERFNPDDSWEVVRD
ncbi:DUF2950 family protein [Stappia taiwanensis]|uniref:DUF2950 family protein n=1 Tax=Stappia taiwanensis TaxID=992267 RepID=A0A838XXX9_9HYPH|nr:DUF2950 family protein [Stappia taiwanensis]MBA4613388.1 DUF2950 family protein [Stappia taiwanensis]GGE82175.1 hypothetical protein GCM10007285_07210 [Stappia taiwanensis]